MQNFWTLAERHRPSLLRQAFLFTQNIRGIEAEDILQDALIRASKSWHAGLSFLQWVRQAMQWVVLDALRARGKCQEVQLFNEWDIPDEDEADGATPRAYSDHFRWDAIDQRIDIGRAIDNLDEDHKARLVGHLETDVKTCDRARYQRYAGVVRKRLRAAISA